MAVFKCKMCGAPLDVTGNEKVTTCEYCQTVQTLPNINNEVVANLYNRANNLRLQCEFDKAEQVYEKILEVDNTEAEAHWGMVLCKYGIEYVEDPSTYTRIPTCHRTSFDVILTDTAYISAVENADSQQKAIYEEEAKKINTIQSRILDIAKNEKPFDVFICYKETDENGKRTVDSVLANDIYHQLTNEGFKVFYAAITLEDKLGQEYEPYIFAALNSSKVMIVLSTKPEYFNAVWVKNEWSRFLKKTKEDRSCLLIPCYRDINAYDLPEEFSLLQAQDMSKIGFINDIIRGIKKIIVKTPANEPSNIASASTQQSGQSANVTALLTRVNLFLEDGDFNSAKEYCETILDTEPENAKAYLYKMLATIKLRKIEDIATTTINFTKSRDFIKAERFADDELKNQLRQYRNAFCKNHYDTAKMTMENAKTALDYKKAAEFFDFVIGYEDSADLKTKCLNNAAQIESEKINLANEIYRKKTELANLKNSYLQSENNYNFKKTKLQHLKNNSKISLPIFITAAIGILSQLTFDIFVITSDGKLNENLLLLWRITLILTPISCIIFAVVWLRAWRKMEDINTSTIIKKLCWILIPFAIYIVGIKDGIKFSSSLKSASNLETDVQNTYNVLSQQYKKITELEAEIQQMEVQQTM